MSGWETGSWFFFGVLVIANIIITIVATIGGVFDLRYLFRSLKEEQVDVADDGRVTNEAPLAPKN